MELLLIRHGLPVRREVSNGPADPELAPEGHAQAEHMANYLSTERIDAVIEDDVAEYDRHSSEYVPIEELKASGDPRFHQVTSGMGDGLDDGLDDADEFRTRVMASLGQIIDEHPSQTVAVVCHGGVINFFLASILGLPMEPPGFFYPNYTSINRVAASRSGVRSIVTVNETAHLRNTGLPMGLFQKG